MKEPQGVREPAKPIFVAGASGYIGGRLVPCLLERGYRVRCLARSPKKLEDRGWASEPQIEIVGGDLADTGQLVEQMGGCGAAYYLAHSMLARDADLPDRDQELASSCRFDPSIRPAGELIGPTIALLND